MKKVLIHQFGTLVVALFLAASSQVMAQNAATKDVVQVANDATVRGQPVNKTLVKLLDASGLSETLKSGGPYTLFAPTDDAFAKLPKGKLEDLLKPENKEELVKLLKHHVVSGKFAEAELSQKTEVTPLEGSPLAITAKGTRVKQVGGAATGDDQAEASNGIVYRIKAVLVP